MPESGGKRLEQDYEESSFESENDNLSVCCILSSLGKINLSAAKVSYL